jgi:TonB family protein
MRVSLLASLIIHLCIIIGLFFVLRVVPRMRLPSKIYSVKILQPVLRKSEPPKAEVKVEEKKPEVKKPAPAKPKEKPKKKEAKPEPKAEEKPLDVSVDKEEGDQTSLVVDGPRFPFSYYLSAVERKVSQNWFSSVSTGEVGLRCVVYFQLRRNGSVSDVRVEESSGNSYFDRSALRAVRSASPFPPLPKAFTESFLGIHFTFLQKD